jgi:hypothetical protein
MKRKERVAHKNRRHCEGRKRRSNPENPIATFPLKGKAFTLWGLSWLIPSGLLRYARNDAVLVFFAASREIFFARYAFFAIKKTGRV